MNIIVCFSFSQNLYLSAEKITNASKRKKKCLILVTFIAVYTIYTHWEFLPFSDTNKPWKLLHFVDTGNKIISPFVLFYKNFVNFNFKHIWIEKVSFVGKYECYSSRYICIRDLLTRIRWRCSYLKWNSVWSWYT